MRSLSLIAALLLPSLDLGGLCAGEDPLEDFVRITRLNEQKKQAELSIACRQFLTDHPETKADDLVRFHLGQSLAAQKQYDPAIATFTELLVKHPDSPLVTDAAMQRGEAYRNSERLQESVPDFETAWQGYRDAESVDNAAHAAYHLVQAYHAKPDLEKAKALTAILQKAYPTSNYARNAANLIGAKPADAPPKPESLPVGSVAPDVEFVRLSDGATEKLSAYRGKVVVLDFWASWCGPCQAPMAKMQTYAEAHPNWSKKVALIALSIDNTKAIASAHLATKGWGKTINAWAGEGGFRAPAPLAYGIRGIPTVYIIDAAGKIAATGHPGSLDISKTVEDLLAKVE